jgi:tetratricopeptide (TPR) repeat protein
VHARLGLALLVVILLTATAPGDVPAQTTEADVFVAQAIVDIDDGRYDAALTNLARALEIDPDHTEALFYTGVAHSATQRPELGLPFLQRARANSPTDPVIAYHLGLAHFALEQYAEAEPLLTEAFRQRPDLDGVGYYVGFLRYRNKQYRAALDAFRATRTSDPEVQQLAHFYTGLTLGVLGLPEEAAAEVQHALRVAPGTRLIGPAERLRDTVLATRQRDRLSLEARVGVFYDDNVRVIPDASAGDPLVRDLRHGRRDSMGELAGIRADYQWWRTPDWESTIGVTLFGTYVNDLPDFSVFDTIVSASVARNLSLLDRPAQAGVQYAFDWLALGGDEYLTRHNAGLFGTIAESARHLTQAFGRYQHKEFSEAPRPVPDERRDGHNYMAGLLHFIRFAEDRHYLKLGYQIDYEDTLGDNYEYVGHRFTVGGRYTLPWAGIRLTYDFDAHLRSYHHANSILPLEAPGTRRRQDEELTHVLRAELPLPERLTLALDVQRTDGLSNIDLFDYTRHVVSLILSWTY